MQKFQKDHFELLRELKALVKENIEAADINPNIEEEVAEYITDVVDKRRRRKLKAILKEVEKWLDKLETLTKNSA